MNKPCEHCLISPTLIQYHSETSKDGVRGQTIEDPIMTVDSSNRYGLVTSFLHKYYDGGYKGAGETVENPLPTVTAWDHNSVVTANLIQMNNHCDGKDIYKKVRDLRKRIQINISQSTYLWEGLQK